MIWRDRSDHLNFLQKINLSQDEKRQLESGREIKCKMAKTEAGLIVKELLLPPKKIVRLHLEQII